MPLSPPQPPPSRRLAWPLLWALISLATGCGGASAERPPPDPTAAFAEIQVHEATLARSAHPDGPAHLEGDEAALCAWRCERRAEAEGAAARICELAEALQDADALSRCRAARRAALEVREAPATESEPAAEAGHEGECACPPTSPAETG